MTLVDHLRELRSRLVKASLAVVVTTVVAWFFYGLIVELLTKPVCDLPDTKGIVGKKCGVLTINDVLGPLSIQLKVSIAAGLVAASPVWLWQVWGFLAPGLHRREKKWAVYFVAAGVPLFLVGAWICYLVLPKAVSILLGFTPQQATNLLPLDQYLNFVVRMILVFGLSFELPVVLLLLNVAGILSARRMQSWWRMMIFGIFVFAAVATPTGDPGTMMFLAAPMMVLYAVALLIARFNDKRRGRGEPDYSTLGDDEISPLDDRPSPLDDDER